MQETCPKAPTEYYTIDVTLLPQYRRISLSYLGTKICISAIKRNDESFISFDPSKSVGFHGLESWLEKPVPEEAMIVFMYYLLSHKYEIESFGECQRFTFYFPLNNN